ncbi:MAG TPA: prenyltransferase/squalene oxidase repeat-containing protein, partial [Pirellulales bacterium]
FLEATPLTSFVVLSLVGAGEAEHPVVRRGIEFLLRSVRDDGSWPIDTNLATWVTTLAVGALNNHVRLAVARDAEDGLPSPSPRYWTAWEGHPPCPPVAHGELTASCPVDESLPPVDAHRIVDWLLSQQYRTIHPYTNAAPGGWAWTDLSGGVPDADDTPGALLALWSLAGPAAAPSAAAGAAWLLDLQNSDGGIPTFCRGWGLLPFDRSSADLTAHTLRAWSVWYDHLPALQARIDRAARRAWRFLAQAQRPDGAWAPLWFGNQHLATEENLTYGTSRVLLALASVREAFLPVEVATTRILNASRWLLAGQNADGGWGGGDATPSSLEETALAVEALCAVRQCTLDVVKDALTKLPSERGVRVSIDRGLGFLIERTQCGRQFDPAPIGFYFAKLWYYEKLYPIVYSLAAAGRASGFYTSRGHEIQT